MALDASEANSLLGSLIATAHDPYLNEAPPLTYVFCILSAITLILTTGPLIWHFRNGNIPAGMLVFWNYQQNVYNFINPLIWPTDNLDPRYLGQGWCDIGVKLQVGAALALAGSVICVMRALARALNTNKPIGAARTYKDSTREKIIVWGLCVGSGIYMMIIHYIVQPYRYNLLAITGCYFSVDQSWVAVVFFNTPPLIFILVVMYYSILLLYRLYIYRKKLASVLAASSSGLSLSRFLRLLFVSVVLVLIFTPIQIYFYYINLSQGIGPYSFAEDHDPDNWALIYLIPTFGQVVPWYVWINTAVSFVLFAAFGTGTEAMNNYRSFLVMLGLARIWPSLNKPVDGPRLRGGKRIDLKSPNSPKSPSIKTGSWGTISIRLSAAKDTVQAWLDSFNGKVSSFLHKSSRSSSTNRTLLNDSKTDSSPAMRDEGGGIFLPSESSKEQYGEV